MHVSLPRRSHRVGHTTQYLRWICFGVLAVVPWQALCGEDQSANPVVKRTTDEGFGDEDLSNTKKQTVRSGDKPSTNICQKSLSTSPTPSLIVRGQNGPFDPGFQSQPAMPQQSPNYPPSQYDLQPQFAPGRSTPFVSPRQLQQGSSPFGPDQASGRSGEAFGFLTQVGALTGPAIGRTNPLFPVELMPYLFQDNNLLFADVRGFRSNTNNFGGNFGGGYRRYVSRWDRIFGVNGYYDYDDTSGNLFQQLGIGLESLGELFDIRANGYFPTGVSAKELSLVNVNGTQAFVNHFLTSNQLHTIANSLHGFDTEIGVPLPGPTMQRHDVRVFGGGYWYECNNIPGFGGFKTRIQGNVLPSIAMQLEVTHDTQFKTNVIFGASWTYGGFQQSDGQQVTQYNRMTTPVRRNYNVVVGISHTTDFNVEAINPATGNPYFIEHVDSNSTIAGAGDGTVENPFKVFTDAQGIAGTDIIFVHANDVFTGVGVNLEPNVRVLGEASTVEHEVLTLLPNSNPAFGNFLLLPHPTPIPVGQTVTNRPEFLNAPGTGVTLADNSEFSGFQVGLASNPASGPAGVGILGNGISNAVVRQTDVSFSGLQGVLLENTTGTIVFRGDTINDPSSTTTNTFQVSGTASGSIVFSSDPLSDSISATGAVVPTPGVINNVIGSGGMALLVNNTAVGSTVDFTGSIINDTLGNGVLITTDAGAVSLGDINSTNSLSNGLNILNDSGVVTANGTINVVNATGDSITISGLTTTGSVLFTGLDIGTTNPNGIAITNRQARGIFLNNNAGNVSFLTPVSIAAAGAVAPAAIEYQGSSGNVAFFDNLTINNGTAGILIGQAGTTFNTGRFVTDGNTLITNTTGIAIEVTNDKSTDTFSAGITSTGQNATLTINQRGNIGIEVLNNLGAVNFNNTTNISNANATTLPGVDIRGNQNVAATVTFGTLNITNAAGPAPAGFGGVGFNVGGTTAADANTAQVTVNQLNVTSNGGTAVFVENEGRQTATATTGLIVASGTILATNGAAIDIENSIMRTIFTSVSSTASPTDGITLINDQSFTQLVNPTTLVPTTVLADYMFSVVGTGVNTARQGGIIQTAVGDGVRIVQTGNLFQTGDVNLNQLTINQNASGVVATGLLQLNIADSAFTQNVNDGILATNIPSVDIITSSFLLNGAGLGGNAIHLTANTALPINGTITGPTDGQYLWSVTDNQTTVLNPQQAGFIGGVGSGSLVLVDSPTALTFQNAANLTQVTPLVFNFDRNIETVAFGNGSGVADNWTGAESGTINQNTILLQGNDSAISITNNSIANSTTSNLTNFLILGNNVTGNGGGNFGINVNNFDPTDLQINTFVAAGVTTANTFTFTTPVPALGVNNADIAMQFSLLNSQNTDTSAINIANTTISMIGASLDQGIVFTEIQAPASVIFNNNNITVDVRPNAPFVGMGIDFQTVIGIISVGGTVNNTITANGANTIPNAAGVTAQDWVFIPTGTTTGQFFVNGFSGP